MNSPVGVVWPRFLDSSDGTGDETMLSASVQTDAMFFSVRRRMLRMRMNWMKTRRMICWVNMMNCWKMMT